MPPKTQQDSQALPNKEAALFRTLIKQYETKQYKKGIKTADLILKKFPDNGETQAMKGLLYNCLEKKAEAYELVKLGVKNNIRSHVCWHVYGLLYRSDQNYDEAIKCYKNALRMEKDNLNILRDLAQLQIQMRDLPGFLDTRQILLEQKANNGQNWVAFALAHHLNDHHEVAAEVLDQYESIIKDEDSSASDAYELNEILLYKVQILFEGGLLEQALSALSSAEDRKLVKDKIGAMELRAKIYLAMSKFSEAEEVYRKLVALNPENYKYHDGLRAALELLTTAEAAAAVGHTISDTQRTKLSTEYSSLQEKYPRCTAAKRIPLDFLTGQEFIDAADAFVRPFLTKGIPSLFSALKPLYASPEKAQQLGELMLRLETSLASSGTFPPLAVSASSTTAAANNNTNNSTNGNGEAPTLVWTRLYLALHYDALGNTAEALKLIDQCITDCPSLVDLHSARSRILKHAGDFPAALQAAEVARKQETADRYINCLAVKAGFKAGEVERAETTAALFTRDGEQNNNLFDMQATWYEIGSGRAYLQRGDIGRALKRFLKVDAHFADFVEDQFDFHSYCVRKQTMRAYVDMLRMEDELYSHKVYSKAIQGAVIAYLQLHDNPKGLKEKEDEDKLLASMSVEEARKYRAKKRKEEQKKVKEAETAAAEAVKKGTSSSSADAAGKSGKKVDPDPHGEQLASTEQPLEEASKLIKRLVHHAGNNLINQLLAAEVYCKRGKLLLALKAVQAAAALEGTAHPGVHKALVRLALATEKAPTAAETDTSSSEQDQNPVVLQVLQEHVAKLLEGQSSAEAYHAAWVSKHGSASALHRAAAVDIAVEHFNSHVDGAVKILLQGGVQGASHKECVAIYEMLNKSSCRGGGDAPAAAVGAAASQWKATCAEAYQFSRVFGGSKCVALNTVEEEGDANGAADKLAKMEIKS